MKPALVTNLAKISNQYDVYLFDIYGVIHEGSLLKPAVLEAIEQLTSSGKIIFFVSNAPLRAYQVKMELEIRGLDESKYFGILTAGDQTYLSLKARASQSSHEPRKRCYFIGNASMMEIVPRDTYELTNDITLADFIVAAGPENHEHAVEDYYHLFLAAAQRSLPMICSNPDLQVFRDGRREMRAGEMAALYHSLGGKVTYYGKPFKPTYDMVCSILHEHSKERMLVIGDSIYTDIMGANHSHIDSLLTISNNTLHEMHHSQPTVSSEHIMAWLKKLGSTAYLPTYFSNPLTW